MGVRISGVGAYLPRATVSRDAALASQGRLDRYGQIPADYFDVPATVHHAGDGESASYMGAQACLAALSSAGLRRDEVDLVLCFSVVNDNTYPKDGQAIVHLAALERAVAIDVDLACGSFQTLLKIGAALVEQGMHRRVALVCTANWVHRAIDKTQDHSPLGDGAGAVILEQGKGTSSFLGMRERREERFFDFVRMGCSTLTGKAETIQFTFTDQFKSYVKLGATDVAKELMAEIGIMPADVDWLVCHQVGEKAVRGWGRSLEIGEEKILSTYMTTGNCMASNMPLVLDWFVNKEPRVKRGDVILFFSLSMGYHSSATLWRY